MLQAFKTYLKNNHLLQPGQTFIVATSGGIDSVVLCALCKEAGLTFSIAHCNFNLRGAESNRDEAFVRSLAQKLGVPVHVKNFDTKVYGEMKKLSIQEAARELRYHWFEALRKELNATYVLLAHHANDNIETVLMNFFRGTGLHGLTGMPEKVDAAHCLRPLLQHTRNEIESYAAENKLSWVEDSSNSSSKYTRNFFRNELLPALQKVYPQVEENLSANIERFKKTENLYASLVATLQNKLLQKSGNEFKIGVKHLLQYAATSLPYEVFKKFDFTEKQVSEIMKLADSESGRYVENDMYRVIKNRAWFIISPKFMPFADTIVIEAETKKAILPHGSLSFKKMTADNLSINTSKNIAFVAAEQINYPMLLRKWKEGDYFYPLGMPKKKKLARFFIDQKLSLTEKENTWVLEMDKKIIWVVGHRIDDRFKILPHTKKILQVTLTTL